MAYWADRVAKNQSTLSKKRIKQIEKQLIKYYGSAMERVIKDFESTYNKLLATMEDGRQPTPADLYKLGKYWEAQAQMREILRKLGEKQIVLLSKEFELNFFEIYYSFGLEGKKAFNTIDKSMVQQMINQIWVADGKSWSQRIWRNTELLAETLNEELIHCVATGKKTTELKHKLQERFGVSYSNADALARTEISHIQTEAAKKRYEDYGIKKVQVWADEDERRCEVCGELHEKIYDASAAVPIPCHTNCRCCLVPYIE